MESGLCAGCGEEMMRSSGTRGGWYCKPRCRRAAKNDYQKRIRTDIAEAGVEPTTRFWIKFWRSKGILKVPVYQRVAGGMTYIEHAGQLQTASDWELFATEADALAEIARKVRGLYHDAIDYQQRAQKKLDAFKRERDLAAKLGIKV